VLKTRRMPAGNYVFSTEGSIFGIDNLTLAYKSDCAANKQHIAELEAEIAERRMDYGEDCKRLDARIAELEQQLAAMTAERDSESRWAKKYSDEADELRQQLAAAQENTLGPWFLTQGLCTLDAIADHIITLQRQLTAAQERNTKLQSEHLDHVYALHEQLTAANAEIERGLWDAINNPPEQDAADDHK